MHLVGGVAHSIGWFVVVLTLVVFFHELGHYLVARICGVKVEVFSVGFGRELFGFTDRTGTRWKFSLIPLGGYVKFYGDVGYAGEQDHIAASKMSREDREVSFHHKSLARRTAIVAAGPAANFLLAIIILIFIFSIVGRAFTPPVVGEVLEGSAALAAGMEVSDRIISIDDKRIRRFEDIRDIVMFSPGKALNLHIERAGQLLEITVTPKTSEFIDTLGNSHKIGLLGISVGGAEFQRVSIIGAMLEAVGHTYYLSARTLQGIGQIITGSRSTDELGGPILIAQMSGAQAANGPISFFNFVVILSVTLGLINLFPIPILDGGHLLFYLLESIRGKPLGSKVQEYSLLAGLSFIVVLMIFTTFNDLTRPNVMEFFSKITG